MASLLRMSAASRWSSGGIGVQTMMFRSRCSTASASTIAIQLRCCQRNGYSTLKTTTNRTRSYVWPSLQCRYYTPMTKEEEESEKLRVAGLSDFAKDQELRKLNREISYLELKKGILTGDAYTWSGKYKALARDYGMPLVVWYWAVWFSTAILCYAGVGIFDIDVMALLAQLDGYTGWSLTSKVDPQMGKIGMVIVANEALEPIRLPAVIVTVKPVMDRLFPPKY